MKLPQKVKDVRSRFIAKVGLPSGDEDNFRKWCLKFAQQCAFSFPGEGYGVKSSSQGAPQSKDTLANRTLDHFVVWDLFTGSGTGMANLVEDPDSQDVTGQYFITVTPQDFLGGSTTNPDPGTPTPTTDLKPVLDAIATLNARMDTNTQAVRQLFDKIDSMPMIGVDYDRIKAEIGAEVNQLLTDHEANISKIVEGLLTRGITRIKLPF